MFKHLVAALLFSVIGLAAAFGANVTIPSGPQDPSNVGATINSLIISGNSAWAPQGSNFVTAAIVSANSTVGVTMSALGPSGLSPTTIASWLKIKGFINNTATPTFFLVPMWGCPTCN